MRSTLLVLSRLSVPVDEDAREQTYVTTGVPTSSVSSMDMVSADMMLNGIKLLYQKDKLNCCCIPINGSGLTRVGPGLKVHFTWVCAVV